MEETQHFDIIRAIASAMIRREIYVEIGTSDGQTWRRVAPLFTRALGVDIRDDLGEYITPYGEYYGGMTSDDFFAHIGPTITADLVFIDANHLREFVLRDFQNALEIIRPVTGIICLHDTYPPNAGYINGGCWNAWEAAVEIRNTPDCEVLTLPVACMGLTIVRFTPQGHHLHWMPAPPPAPLP